MIRNVTQIPDVPRVFGIGHGMCRDREKRNKEVVLTDQSFDTLHTTVPSRMSLILAHWARSSTFNTSSPLAISISPIRMSEAIGAERATARSH